MSMDTVTDTMRRTTDTTSYVAIHAVMVECDYLEERNQCLDQVTLTRLQYGHRFNGESNNLETVAALQKKLGIQSTKRISVGLTTLYRGRESRMVRHNSIILSEPFGAYYTRMTVPFSILNTEEVCEAWDKNPIGTVEISMIPDNVSPESFRSDRFNRTGTVSLHFASDSFNTVFTLLMALEPGCVELELRNVRATEQQLRVLQLRLKPKWKWLEKITLNNRRTE